MKEGGGFYIREGSGYHMVTRWLPRRFCLYDEDKMEMVGQELIQIKGIGQWTVDMFLMFTLNRADILPYGDLGIQKGIMKILNTEIIPSKKEMENCSKKWKPYRTIACWYLWRITDEKFTK